MQKVYVEKSSLRASERGGRKGGFLLHTHTGFYIVVCFRLTVFTCETVTEEAVEVHSEARLCERE